MTRLSQGKKVPSRISNNSDQISPHPPANPPINVSKRPIQSNQQVNEENENENEELNLETENTEDNENIESNENEDIDNNNIDSNSINTKDSDDSWLNNLPEVIHPDEELHQQLLKQRHEERLNKVTSICHCELEAILNYSFECINRRIEEKEKEKKNANKRISKTRWNEEKEELERYEKARQIRILRTKFRNGFMTPEIIIPQYDPELLSTSVEPFHTLSIQHYLHYPHSSYLPDLSSALNVSISDSHLEDPNPFFNDFLQKLYNSSEKFTKAFGSIGSLKFPYIVCIGGPSGGGRTTVAQFFQKVFDVHIIQLKQIIQKSQKKPKKGAAPPKEAETNENKESEGPTDYLLKSAVQITYSDDKTAVQQIAQEIKSNMDGRGFIIDGFPNNKNQFAALEKELSAAGANMKNAQEELRDRSASQRPPNPKAQFPSINGLIIALNNEENQERLIDPETGNIYNPGFNMPGLPDLIGVSPIEFPKVKNDIEERLVKITVPEIHIIPPKQLQVYTQFEGIAKKTATCKIISHCDKLKSLIESIDSFILELFSKLPHLLPHKTDSNNIITEVHPPFSILMRPFYLLLPHQCYSAIVAWYNCLNAFGKTIAIQNNLAHNLDSRLDVMMKETTGRYQLYIGQKDERLSICDEFVKKNMDDNSGNYNLPQLFRTIWDISLKIRNKNLKHVDEVVGKSGLIELLLELKESPKIFFIALVQRMLYTKWFYETFQHLIYGKPPENPEENKNLNEEEAVNEKPVPPENEQESEKEIEEQSDEKSGKSNKSKGKDSKLSKSKSKSNSRMSKSKGKDSKLSKSKGKDSKLSKSKGKDSKLSKSKGKNSSRMSKSKGKGSKMSSRKGNESENDESSQNLIDKKEEEEEEPFIDKLISRDCEIPDFVLKVDPELLEQLKLLQQQQQNQQHLEEEQIESEIQQQQTEISEQQEDASQTVSNENQQTNVPSINIPHMTYHFKPPHSARPIHPPDSIRRVALFNPNSSSSNEINEEPSTQRADNRKVTFANEQMEDEYQSETENRIKERNMMAKIHGFDYLLNQLHSFCESTKSSSPPFAFDINKAFNELKIQPCEMKASFDDINAYAEEFFSYVAQQVGEEDSLLSNEVKSNIEIFRRFMNLCNSKEASMVNSVFNLRDSLNHYTYAKCTHEMEYFAQQFRKLKQIINSNQAAAETTTTTTTALQSQKNTISRKNSVAVSPKITKKIIPKNSSSSPRNISDTTNKNVTKNKVVPPSPPRSPRRTINERSSPRQNRTIRNALPSANQTINLSGTAATTTISMAPTFKQSYEMLGSPLFEFDVKHVDNDVVNLAELELTLETPIIAQDLVSSDTLIKIAKYASQIHLFHASGKDMLTALQDVLFSNINEKEEEEEEEFDEKEFEKKNLEFTKFQFCMNILECVERFDVLRFLLCFAHSRDEEILIMNIFHQRRQSALA